ncbi:hypothetical protein LshimejAT787_0605750 [Lyophyllum shimeji]|uniref:DUF6534 domain-containing protein n=1 Tax=Lyophyllum shimeji TaxID=47721 RepID=A0A9P3UN85_LYOSH|nr:hypothetical protein LshimejAT787_0605750 [Lyophyllum shimeji]
MASASQTPLPPIPPNIAAIAGPPLVGILLNWFLYGILIMQTYVYYQCFPDDQRKIRFLVYTMLALDTIQSVLATADAFHWFARGFGNMIMLSDPFISAFDAPILDGVIAFIAQAFFSWRIRVLQKSWWLPGVVFLVALGSFVGAIATGIGAFQVANLARLHELTWQLSLWLGGSALADTLIAVIMTFLLLRQRSRADTLQHTDNVLVRIVRLTVETNTVTASVAIVVLICLLAIPKNPSISMAPAYALGKLYSNTLLAVFNNRVYMSSKGLTPRSAFATSGIDVRFRNSPAQSGQATSHTRVEHQKEPYRIEVFQETQVTDDLQMKDFKRVSTASQPHDRPGEAV